MSYTDAVSEGLEAVSRTRLDVPSLGLLARSSTGYQSLAVTTHWAQEERTIRVTEIENVTALEAMRAIALAVPSEAGGLSEVWRVTDSVARPTDTQTREWIFQVAPTGDTWEGQ